MPYGITHFLFVEKDLNLKKARTVKLKKQRFTKELTDNLNVFYYVPIDEIAIMDCICKLNPNLSIYITLRFYNDMTYDEVAQTLKLPVSTVKYKTKKALIELKTLLEGDAK